ncbi:MAG: hypothetical protein R3D80_04180 [Paracoccaceae bacterium]
MGEDQYRHWRVEYDGDIANLFMDVDEDGGLFEGYKLKLNSYDFSVDIEPGRHRAADALRAPRGEGGRAAVGQGKGVLRRCQHPHARGAAHSHKVNFCKFTNETRNTFEAAEDDSGQKWIAAVKGACAGGGYEPSPLPATTSC